MNPSLIRRLEDLQSRFEELGMELSDPEVIGNQDKFRKFSQEYAQLEPVIETFKGFRAGEDERANLKAMLKEDDAEIREMAEAELESLSVAQEEREQALQVHLLPRDPAAGGGDTDVAV